MGLELPEVAHPLLSVLYVVFLLCLTIFWPSISLIVLLSTHTAVVLIMLLKWSMCNMFKLPNWFTGRKDDDIDGRGNYESVLRRLPNNSTVYNYATELLSFHFIHRNTAWFNIIHLVILLANFSGFLTQTHNSSPPSTLKLPSKPFDHSLFGVSTGGILAEQEDLSLQKLAQTGFYYAERYHGKFGTNGAACTSSSGWHCYAVGVRHDMDNGQSFYQPLLTPSYDVDVQVAVSPGLHPVNKCVNLDPIFVQHVRGDEGPIDARYLPLVDSAYDKTQTQQMCPTAQSSIGCMQNQRQTYQELTDSIRNLCQADESIVHHNTDGFKYDASYIRITSGKIVAHTPSLGLLHPN